MELAREEAARGELAAARERMAACEATLAAAPAMDEMTRGLVADLRDAQTSMQRQDEYARMGSKKLAAMSRMHGKQRACAYEGSAGTEMYAGGEQRMMKAAFKSSVR